MPKRRRGMNRQTGASSRDVLCRTLATIETLESRQLLSFGVINPSITNVNVTKMPGEQATEAITVDRADPTHLFAFSNNNGNGMVAASSSDSGATWQTHVIADGSDNLPQALSDPAAAFDQYGNLFIAYLRADGNNPSSTDRSIEVALSTDGGMTFTPFAAFNGDVDRPNIATGASTVWIAYTRFTNPAGSGQPMAAGATVRALGQVSQFESPEVVAQRLDVGGVTGLTIGSSGQLLMAYQLNHPAGPTTLFTAQDDGGLTTGHTWASTQVTTTNVGTFYAIPAQNRRTIDPSAGVAFDTSSDAFNGREYFVYTDTPANQPDNTNIYLRYSDDDGKTWSSPIQVNDDKTRNSQFFPRIAVDPVTGYVAMSWYDCRNSSDNQDVQVFAAIGTPMASGVSISANVQVSAGTSNSSHTHAADDLNQFGDWAGLDFYNSICYPAWSDDSNSTGDNPDPTTFDVYTAKLQVSTESGPPIDATGPSLSATLVRVPTAASVGSMPGSLTYRIFNSGPGKYIGPLTVQFFASADGTLDDSATPLGDAVRICRLINSGKTGLFVFHFTYPSDVPPNSYFFIAEIDPADSIAQSTYANQTTVSTMAVQISPPVVELSAQQLAVPKVRYKAGQKLTVIATIQNAGNVTASGPVTLNVFSSGDGTFDPAATGELLATTTANLLIPVKRQRHLLLHPTLTVGTYQLVLQVVDADDSNPANNVFISPLVLNVMS